MPSLKDIRRRIQSVKSTQKITRAQKLVSVAKFARATAAVTASRPYGRALDAMVAGLVAAAGDDVDSPLLVERPEKKTLVVMLSTDRGFCGSLNSNLFKQTLLFLADKRTRQVELEFVPWGRRAFQFTKKLKFKAVGEREKTLEKITYERAKELSAELTSRFVNEGFDRVYVAFVEFKSAMTQTPAFVQLLPVPKGEVKATDAAAQQDVLVEPDVKTLLDNLLRRQVTSRIFRCLLEGAASEHGARMTAMDSATNNANEVLRKMNIQYNRARQAAITKELIEITSGAQAL
jgi:F-type H+-transporting ATPase subunit gamma